MIKKYTAINRAGYDIATAYALDMATAAKRLLKQVRTRETIASGYSHITLRGIDCGYIWTANKRIDAIATELIKILIYECGDI